MSSTLTVTTSSKRRFEFVQGNSRKFWSISIDGAKVSVVYGRIGTVGQTNDKQFPSAADAVKHAENLIRQKTSKGYSEAA